MWQIGSGEACPSCSHKQKVIDKYSYLAALLAKKAAKYDSSKSKISAISSSLQNHSHRILVNTHTVITAINHILARRERQVYLRIKQIDGRYRHGWSPRCGLPSITSTGDIQIHQRQEGEQRQIKGMKNQAFTSKNKLVNESNIQNYSLSAGFQKDLTRKLFLTNLENEQLRFKMNSLRVEVQEGVRRQEKQIAKKRQSLQGLSEELSEKNELIQELKITVKVLEGKLGLKQKGILHGMLQQDSESLRKVVFRLENINDKLNIDLDKVKKEKVALEGQLKEVVKQNEELQQIISKLREENFDLQQNRFAVATFKKELEIMSQKLNSKMEKLRKFQRKMGDLSKAREGLPSNILENMLQLKTDRRMATTQAQTVTLQRTATMRDLQLQNKLQSIFTYLFHIDDHSHHLQYYELFDEEERQLLYTHKEKYMAKLKLNYENSLEVRRPRERRFSEDECSFGDSVLDVLQQPEKPLNQTPEIAKRDDQTGDQERITLVEKISELKERQMHIRSVIHSFLKSMDLKSLKKQSQAIFTILCDLFEYSQGERNLLYQSKGRKLFGFI